MARTQGAEFAKKMKKTHKIWLPDMLHYHNELLQAAFLGCGYQLEILPMSRRVSDYSQPYISGDYCFPIFCILGQLLAFLESGDCDVDRTAFMEPQTGGACRAGNYYNSIIESLKKAGYPQIPVISLNAFGEERHPGFSITPRLLFGAVTAVCYGDLLMTLLQQVRPYERTKGQAEDCRQKWMRILSDDIRRGKNISGRKRRERYQEIIEDFKGIPTQKKEIKKVGIAGEVYMKFSPVGNEQLEDYLQGEGCDYRMGGFVKLHPFGCLVSHVCIRGIIKKLRARFPGVNIQAIEYDYDSSKTLRESRILLGLSDFK